MIRRSHPRSTTDTATAAPSASRRRIRRLPLWQRVIVGILLAPIAITGAASAAYYFQLHIDSEAVSLKSLPVAPKPTANRRMLVLSPHCDDETLGVGGQIADARRAGVPVTVAFLTNGDGFRIAASRALGKVNVGPTDFVRFAELRQRESLAALGELGVPAGDVKFLGYPDRGLRPMWETNWDSAHPFRSGFTGSDHSPYDRTLTPHAPYSGQAMIADLVRLMESSRPTDILVTHPADDHPDHSAAAAFTEAALRDCRSRGDDWARTAHIHYYIVHRGDWPIPQGNHPANPLLPPPGLVMSDSRWTVCPLSDYARAAKTRALDRYRSQMEIEGRFYVSFLRSNELYTDLATPETHDRRPGVTAGVNTTATPPLVGECETASAKLYGDNLARYVEPAGDITELSVQRIGDALRIRLHTRAPASPAIRYAIRVRGVQTGADGKDRTEIAVENVAPVPSASPHADAPHPPASASPTAVPTAPSVATVTAKVSNADRHELTTTIPLARVGLSGGGHDACLWVSAESRWTSQLPTIDRTGYREFHLN